MGVLYWPYRNSPRDGPSVLTSRDYLPRVLWLLRVVVDGLAAPPHQNR
jgi:hypothetical protein